MWICALALSLAAPPHLDHDLDRKLAEVPKGFVVTQPDSDRGVERTGDLPFTFSFESDQVAFFAAKRKRVHAFLGDDEVAKGDLALAPRFAREGGTAVFAVGKSLRTGKQEWSVYVDGKRVRKEPRLDGLVVADSGDGIGYWIRPEFSADNGSFREERKLLVLLHREGKRFKRYESETVRSYGDPLGIRINDEGTLIKSWFFDTLQPAIVSVSPTGTDRETLRVPNARRLYFSDDLAHTTATSIDYSPLRDESNPQASPYAWVWNDGEALDATADACGNPVWSTGREHLAYVFHHEGKFGIGVDDVQSATTDALIQLAVPSADGKRVAVVVREDHEVEPKSWLTRWYLSSASPGKSRVALVDVDGLGDDDWLANAEFGPPCGGVWALTLSPDGQHIAYRVLEGRDHFMRCGSAEIGPSRGMTAPRWLEPGVVAVGTLERNEFWMRHIEVAD